MNPEKMVISEARRTYTYLGLFGYAVDTAEDGIEGLHLGASGRYDAAIVDLDRGLAWAGQDIAKFEAATEDFRRANHIPPQIDSIAEIDTLLTYVPLAPVGLALTTAST